MPTFKIGKVVEPLPESIIKELAEAIEVPESKYVNLFCVPEKLPVSVPHCKYPLASVSRLQEAKFEPLRRKAWPAITPPIKEEVAVVLVA